MSVRPRVCVHTEALERVCRGKGEGRCWTSSVAFESWVAVQSPAAREIWPGAPDHENAEKISKSLLCISK